MKKRRKKETKSMIKSLIIFCIVLAVTLMIIITSLEKLIAKDAEISDEQLQVEVQKQQEENLKNTEESVIISKLTNMGERDRMEYYFSQFIKAIEAEKYDKAYEMLYDEYKRNYFPTLSEFEKYAKQTFPKMMSVEHTNFERSGNVYILFVTISNSLSVDIENNKEMKFVVKEEALNDFVISFSVI